MRKKRLMTPLDYAEKAIMNVTRTRRGSEFESSREVASRVLDHLEVLRKNKGNVSGTITGFSTLDRMTNGFHPGDLIILAARPAVGKSAFALNVASNAASANEGAVALFSLEMSADQLMNRMLSCESSVPQNQLSSGHLSERDIGKLNKAANILSERKIYIDNSSDIRVSQIFSKCRKLKADHGKLSLIVIDYLQLINGSGRSDSRQQEISEISRSLKILAMELECPVMALSQLSRRVEDREDHRPKLSDLRESGSIEQDADMVMFLFREDYYKKDEDKKEEQQITQLELSKHRNGPTGVVTLMFDLPIARFTSVDMQRGAEHAD